MGQSSMSAPGKPRRALLAEGSHPFCIVGAAAELTLVVALDVELLAQGALQAFVNRLLGARESTGGRGGELQREAFDHCRKLRVLDAAPDQAQLAACSA